MTKSDKDALSRAGYFEGGLGAYMFKSKTGIRDDSWIIARSKMTDETTLFVDENTLEVSFEGTDRYRKELLDEYYKIIKS